MDTRSAASPPPPVTARRNDGDGCAVRDRWLEPAAEARALADPATRRLFVAGAGHYLDRHGHLGIDRHGHPQTRIYVCVKGEAWVQRDARRYAVPAGSAVLFPGGVPQSYGPTRLPWSIWWCSLAGTDVVDVMGSTSGTSSPIVRLAEPYRFVSIIDEITTLYEREQSPTAVVEAAASAWRLLATMGVDRARRRTLADPLRAAMDHLASNVAEAITVPELAALVGASQDRLTEQFREATGAGVLAYQIGLRMAKARRLLRETDASVSEIAREVGYADPLYFSRQFRRAIGVSPSRFRHPA